VNIYILRDGEKMGPFSEETLRTLLEQGDVDESDLACRQGASEWDPVGKVLETPAESPAELPPPPPPEPEPEPATAEQIAFLSYFGVEIPAGLQKEEAEKRVAKAKEDSKNAKRLALWEIEKLQLHPDLFAEELKARKEDRAQFFHDLCVTLGSDYFTGVTKAHCQVLVAFLDVKFPSWDGNEDADAAERYFFPAVSEKFPQLVNKAWRGKFHYGYSPAAGMANGKSPTSKLAQRPDSPVLAILRGLLLGLFVLGLLYGSYVATHGGKWQIWVLPTPAPQAQ
jgi:hypothetical protein